MATRVLHGCEVRDIEQVATLGDDAPRCGAPARLKRLPNGVTRWVCDQHAPLFEPEAKPAR